MAGGQMYYGGGQPGVYQYSGGGSAPTGRAFEGWANNSLQGGFDAWKQRQFSTQPFSGAGDQYSVQPGGFIPGGGGGGQSNNQPWKTPSQWDPRQIMQSPAFQQLMQFAQQGSGAPGQARADLGPAMDWMRQQLTSQDPLGTSGIPQQVEQRGLAALRDQGSQARRRIDESAGGLNSASNPMLASFMKELARFSEAGGIGGVARDAGEARINERAASKAFQGGVSSSLGSLGLGLGALSQQDFGARTGAAGQALTAESFARNQWASAMADLLRQSMYGNNQQMHPVGGSRDSNPYPSNYDYNMGYSPYAHFGGHTGSGDQESQYYGWPK